MDSQPRITSRGLNSCRDSNRSISSPTRPFLIPHWFITLSVRLSFLSANRRAVWSLRTSEAADRDQDHPSGTNVRVSGRFCLFEFKIKIRFIVMHTHEICPRLLTRPGWHLLTHTCTGSHTHRDRCRTLERWAAKHSARGAWGYCALLKGTSAVARRWTATPPAVSPPIFLERQEWESNRQPPGY